MSTVTPNHPIHPPYEDKVSLKVESQLPDFVKKDHETFVSFMEAYFEYMEQPGKAHEIIGNLDNYANIDKTVCFPEEISLPRLLPIVLSSANISK